MTDAACRLCLGTGAGGSPLRSIFRSGLPEAIMACAGIQMVAGDALSSLICAPCESDARLCLEFRRRCQRADRRARDLLTPHTPSRLHNSLEPHSLPRSNPPVTTQERDIRTAPKRKKSQCDTCGRLFNRRSHLIVHIKTHTGEKRFQCDTCMKSFRLKHHLQVHIRKHTEERPYQCVHCGKRFSEASSHSRHLKIHSGERKFGCRHCTMRFGSASDARRHSTKHTGERPYKCDLCTGAYTDRGSLSRHKRRRHLTHGVDAI